LLVLRLALVFSNSSDVVGKTAKKSKPKDEEKEEEEAQEEEDEEEVEEDPYDEDGFKKVFSLPSFCVIPLASSLFHSCRVCCAFVVCSRTIRQIERPFSP
jgi:hypothetical protein